MNILGFGSNSTNPDFKSIKFDVVRNQAGLNSFVFTPKLWVEKTLSWAASPRPDPPAAQLVCLFNLKNLNALFIKDGLPQGKRLARLNAIAIHQMTLLTADAGIKRLEPSKK